MPGESQHVSLGTLTVAQPSPGTNDSVSDATRLACRRVASPEATLAQHCGRRFVKVIMSATRWKAPANDIRLANANSPVKS